MKNYEPHAVTQIVICGSPVVVIIGAYGGTGLLVGNSQAVATAVAGMLATLCVMGYFFMMVVIKESLILSGSLGAPRGKVRLPASPEGLRPRAKVSKEGRRSGRPAFTLEGFLGVLEETPLTLTDQEFALEVARHFPVAA